MYNYLYIVTVIMRCAVTGGINIQTTIIFELPFISLSKLIRSQGGRTNLQGATNKTKEK